MWDKGIAWTHGRVAWSGLVQQGANTAPRIGKRNKRNLRLHLKSNGAPRRTNPRFEVTAPKTDISFVASTSNDNGTTRLAASGGAPRAATSAETSGANPVSKIDRYACSRVDSATREYEEQSSSGRLAHAGTRSGSRRHTGRRDDSWGSPPPRHRRDWVSPKMTPKLSSPSRKMATAEISSSCRVSRTRFAGHDANFSPVLRGGRYSGQPISYGSRGGGYGSYGGGDCQHQHQQPQ